MREITGASGLAKCGGFYYALGDNSSFLFKLNDRFNIIHKYPIYTPEGHDGDSPIPKSHKPDFEAFDVVGENKMIGLGSGSKSPERDRAIVIALDNPIVIKSYPLTGFYNAVRAMEIMKGHELNIEAAAYSPPVLYLFNRGKNAIFSMDYPAFVAFLDEGKACPAIGVEELELPHAGGIPSGFSGATMDPTNEALIITTSVENTNNAYDDGEVLGSFIGLAPITNGKISAPAGWVPIQYQGCPLKVESVTIDSRLAERTLAVALAVDNDDGQSLFLKGTLTW